MAEHDALEIVSFMAGGYRFAVEARQISGMLASAPDGAVAIETLLGLPVAVGERCCLRVDEQGVQVGAPVALRSLPAGVIYPLPALVQARLQLKGVRALVLEAGSAMLLVDLRSLLA